MGTRTNRAFVMLATVLDKAKHRIGGMYASEKLDGYRAIWVPASRGINVSDLPFANVEKKKKLIHATGLFTRYGNAIHAPKAFVDSLPTDRCLDGELWMGRQSFQRTMSVCKREEEKRNDKDWESVKYCVFDSPSYGTLFQDGKINEPNFKKEIVQKQCLEALRVEAGEQYGFESTYNLLKKQSGSWPSHLILHQQELLPFKTDNAVTRLDQMLAEITDEGGEGLILRHPSWSWEPFRSGFMCKFKYQQDDEAKVIGYIGGLGKHKGRLGSLQMEYKGKIFAIGGFTDEERELTELGQLWADNNPGALSEEPYSINFPLGCILTFTFREFSNDGIPKEARYSRKHQS